MKYYFVSDLHGCHPSLLQASLNDSGFNPEADVLVIVGDLVDRGPYTVELLDYIMSLPHWIPIWGNHDYRTREIVLGVGARPNFYDKHNGVANTLHSLAGLDEKTKLHNIWYYQHVALTDDHAVAKDNVAKFLYYCSKCVWAVEFDNLFVTHGWAPHTNVYHSDGSSSLQLAKPLNGLDKSFWIDATWADTLKCIVGKLYLNKPMLVGHCWAAFMRARLNQHKTIEQAIADGSVDFGTFEYNNVTFIDSCVTVSNYLNVVVKEFNEKPFVYATQLGGKVCKEPYNELG